MNMESGKLNERNILSKIIIFRLGTGPLAYLINLEDIKLLVIAMSMY